MQAYKDSEYKYKHERKIKRLNKKLARQKLGSNRRKITEIKLQKEYYKISCYNKWLEKKGVAQKARDSEKI